MSDATAELRKLWASLQPGGTGRQTVGDVGQLAKYSADEIERLEASLTNSRANVEHLREQRDGLLHAARALVKILEDIGEQTDWRDKGQTDRVFAWFEFADLRLAIQRAEESPLAKAVRIARGHQGPPDEPVKFT